MCLRLVSGKRTGAAGSRGSVSYPLKHRWQSASLHAIPITYCMERSDSLLRRPWRTNWAVAVLGTTSRLGITFSSYANRVPTIRCDNVAPSPPLDQAFKDKVTRALYALPTNEKVSTTFNHTRAPGPAGSSAVTYLLPRREPVGEWSKSTDASDAVVEPLWESVVVDFHQSSISTVFPVLDQFANTRFVAEPAPVLRIDMLGYQVTAGSMWEVWTAGVAVNTLCVQNGRQGLALAIGE